MKAASTSSSFGCFACERRAQRIEAARVQLVEAAAEHFLDEVVLRAEVIVDRGEIDVRRRGDLAQRRAGESVPREQRLGGAEDAFLGREVRGVHASNGDKAVRREPASQVKQAFESYGQAAREVKSDAAESGVKSAAV